jgi:hypothetical protein
VETIEMYKKTLEDLLEKVDFLYSGDVINSEKKQTHLYLKHTSFSADLIKLVMEDIYNWSFRKMIDSSEEIIYSKDKISDIDDILIDISDKYKISPKYIFYSNNSNSIFTLRHYFNTKNAKGRFLPSHFNKGFSFLFLSSDVYGYYSPLIKDEIDDFCFYITDSSIQSLVWTLQNLDYTMERDTYDNKHVINYPVYNCSFKSIKVRVKNTLKIREDKINILLDEN